MALHGYLFVVSVKLKSNMFDHSIIEVPKYTPIVSNYKGPQGESFFFFVFFLLFFVVVFFVVFFLLLFFFVFFFVFFFCFFLLFFFLSSYPTSVDKFFYLRAFEIRISASLKLSRR